MTPVNVARREDLPRERTQGGTSTHANAAFAIEKCNFVWRRADFSRKVGVSPTPNFGIAETNRTQVTAL